jgi:26S proteasome regulatory subunit N11
MNDKNKLTKDFAPESLNKNQHIEESAEIKPKQDLFQLKAVVQSVEISQDLLREITDYSIECVPKEAIGLLGGEEIRPNELLISKAIFVTKGSEYSVTFTDKDFQKFEEIIEPIFCVGWWHSHPGYGLFLSQTDINTHIYSFQVAHTLSVALVVDPKDLTSNGLASFKFFQVEGDSIKNQFHYKEIASFQSSPKEK